ncbi:MAG: 6-bladed beta-propeller [Gammaproteobacteria bacterium]|nr:6-bladed beta-propeller [Gammaproteobacteria bacterium]
MAACAHKPGVVAPVGTTVGTFVAKSLNYIQTLDTFSLGYTNKFLKDTLGNNTHRLVRPVAIAARDNHLYIADAGVHILFRYSLAKKLLEKIGTAGDQLVGEAGGIYVAASGEIYVADPAGQQVLKFAPNGGVLQSFRDGPNISRPIAVAVDESTGRVFVADELYSHVVVFSAAGEAIQGIGARGLNAGPGNFRIITDMAMTPEGLYVSDRVELRMQLIDLQGKFARSFGQSDLIFPLAIARDTYGRIYVTDRTDNRLRIFDSAGQLIETVGRNGNGPGEFRLPNDMAIAGDSLYIADSLNGRIQVFKVLPPSVGVI